MQVGDIWYGWIPTNLGKIEFSFIDDKNLRSLSKKYSFKKENHKIIIDSLDLHFISDTSFFKNSSLFLKENITLK